MNFCFRYRETIALCSALAVLLIVWGGSRFNPRGQSAAMAPMTIVLQASEIPKIVESAKAPSPVPVQPPVKTTTRAYLSARQETASTGYAAAAAEAVSESRPPGTTPALPAQSHGSGSIANEEAAYIAAIRAHLQKIKRYPSGREASQDRPAGTAHVRFTLRRDGVLVEAGIERSSGSMLLDSAALATVRRGNYPVFPEPVWVGRGQQEFSVILEFAPAN